MCYGEKKAGKWMDRDGCGGRERLGELLGSSLGPPLIFVPIILVMFLVQASAGFLLYSFLSHLIAVYLWESDLTFLNFRCLLCEMGIRIAVTCYLR